MASNKGLGIPETKGQFQVRGIVTGTEKDNFYKETLTRTNKPFRSINFGVQFNKDATMYVSLNGMEQEKVYFSKSEKDELGKRKTTVKDIPWKDRFTFSEDGFRMIGVNTGVKKVKDNKGNDVNDKKILTQYDACMEIGDNLKDGDCVFIKGNIEYSTYNEKHQIKFEPTQVSLCKDIDFDAEDFKDMANFQQRIVFMSIAPNEDKTKFIVSAKIVTYNTVEDAEFVIKNTELANTFKKGLKPYQSIDVWGNICVEKNTEEVEESDCWGEENNMIKVNSPTVRELVITGADPKTIEKDTYSEEAIDAAIAKAKSLKQATKDFGDSDDWGSVGDASSDEDDPW